MTTRTKGVVWILVGGLWLAGAIVGLRALMDYDNRPGAPAEAPAEWPATSRLARDPHRATLVMLAHPRCDCTRASVAELAELLARTRRRPRTYVVFIRPGGLPGGGDASWERSALWQAASAIDGVTVLRDDLGVEARRFGVETSGQTLLYDVHGRLRFSGGATGGRGRQGENAGRASLLALLDGGPASPHSPVFGCPLFGPADAADLTDVHTHAAQPR